MNFQRVINLLISNYEFKKAFLLVSVFILILVFIEHFMQKFKILLNFISNIFKKYTIINRIPGPPIRFPLLGNLDSILLMKSNECVESQKFIGWLNNLCNKFGSEGILRFWFGPTFPIILISKPETAQLILNSTHSLDKGHFYDIFRVVIGDGVLTSNGEKWKYQRKLLNPSFKFRILEKYMPIIGDNINILMNKIDKLVVKNDGICYDTKSLISLFVLDSLAETLMNVKLDSQISKDEPEYLSLITKLFKIGYYVFMRPWIWYFPIFKRTKIGKLALQHITTYRSFTNNIISERSKSIDKNNNSSCKESAFLDKLLSYQIDNELYFKLRDVRSQVNTFMIAGHDTSTSSISWTLYLIGHHKQVQQKLIEEIDSFYDCLDNGHEDLSIFNLKRLKYMDCVINESLRLYPSGPLIGRKATDDIKVGNYTIPKGTQIYVFIYHIQRNSIDFPEPEVFRPERFLPENSIDRHQYAFIPFSAGSRMCIAKNYGLLQQKALLFRLLRNYRIESLGVLGDVVPCLDFVLTPSNQIKIKFIKRE